MCIKSFRTLLISDCRSEVGYILRYCNATGRYQLEEIRYVSKGDMIALLGKGHKQKLPIWFP